ncbi:hypothetical protein CLAFUW4_13818 [Fulvia fulva]|uniref:Uncharacterized protein n=1 Tax=Passalora fulva TaxID=5499 RepID=A0A9Q8PKM4_PASFU|nr:uncharacterized protein CLAFUR5_13662 [Fulvia fulva]KAK4610264.1 hypothetical protein CLAFUR4_13820 [Fulvia fulva]KAK4610884.1 hypothetical protein CLAFUR0_13824 [Fulvia fulva]UJO24240.1 hypothetical protein CLAFUR5_13662 [Fulvia fulva]WPV21747.1 hypothetical protein CLAFUW4_13818 [Fulvia fulva]WPV37309.1 hypothetical protein CLAFUW7_13826 [Fulvia fulva]
MSSPIHGESVRSQLHEIDEEINRHPEDVEEDARYLAIDLVTPQKVRVKIYIRVPGHTFGDAWTQYAAVVSRCLAPGGWVEMHDFSTFELFYIGHDEAAPAAEN